MGEPLTINDVLVGETVRLTFKRDVHGRKLLNALVQSDESVVTHAEDEPAFERFILGRPETERTWAFSFVAKPTKECCKLAALGLEKIELFRE